MAAPMPEKKGGGMLAMLAPKGPPMADDIKGSGSGLADPDDQGADDDMSMVAGDVMQAFKDKDPNALAESLKAFVSMC